MNAAMFCTAAALPTNFFAKLTPTDLSEMDTLSYFLIRELICLRLSNVSNVGADFLVDNTWLPSTPLALQLWEIAASAREVMDDGEHDLFRDVSEMMEILFKSPRDMMPPLVEGIFQPFVRLICNEGVGPNSPHKLQDLVRNDPENTGSILTDAPLVSFEIGTELSANHAVFSTVFRADCYIRALGKKEWVLESAKTILGIIHGKGDKKTWQDLAQYYTIASLFIKNTREVGLAKEALAKKADAEAAAAPSEDARSRASSARETATGAAEAFRAVLDLPFLEEYNDGSDIVQSMWLVIQAYGIEEGVKSAMERWGGRFNEKKLRDGIRKNIPFELREKYPEPELIVPFLSEDTVPKLSPQDAVCLLANLFLNLVDGKMDEDFVECLYIQALGQSQSQKKRLFPLLCFPSDLKVVYKDEELDIVSVVNLHGSHFTTQVFSFDSSGGIQTTTYDDTKRTARTKNINLKQTIPNIVRVICARTPACAGPPLVAIGDFSVKMSTSGEWCCAWRRNGYF